MKTIQSFLRPFVVILLLLLVFLFLLVIASRITYRQGLEELASKNEASLDLYVSYLQGALEKYEVLPEMLATNSRLVYLLKNPGSRERIDAFNRYLETINRINDAADTYLMNSDGLTIAASNWNTQHPFVGHNFSYRPYFREAMQGKLGRYFALGAASSQRGYYFAYPVHHEGQILGALVVKINIDAVEDEWLHQDEDFFVTDPEGVVFITTRLEWRYHTLHTLDQKTKERVQRSRNYPRDSLSPLPFTERHSVGSAQVFSIIPEQGHYGKRIDYVHASRTMPQAGWEVQSIRDTKEVEQQVLRRLAWLTTFFFVAFMILLLFWQQRQHLADRYLLEEKNRRMLQEANEVLESRVAIRTAELTDSNQRLLAEVEDRQQAEKELRRARRELIHAAKMAALGQMSAGIAHELNNPLAAIRAYADNGIQFLHKDKAEKTQWNLEQIIELTERMGKMGGQLKLFARKSKGSMGPVALLGAVDGAMEILSPVLRKSGVTVHVRIQPEDLQIYGSNVLLQQVIVNLLSNAIHAVDDQEEKSIMVTACMQKEGILLRVRDNGPGIANENVEKIFDPFFTTKEPGKGLGLGLTITARIVDEIGGHIVLVERENGTQFDIFLRPVG